MRNSEKPLDTIIIHSYIPLQTKVTLSMANIFIQIYTQQTTYVIFFIFAHMSLLEQQRKKVSFDVNELSYIIYGSPEQLTSFLDMQKAVTNDPVLKFNPEHLQISRKQHIEIMSKKLVRYHELFQFTPKMKSLEGLFFQAQPPLGVHFSMFYITLNNLCTDKQKKLFLEPFHRGEIYGCYAQTELGHGSDVQNLQTTATYDKATQTFVLNSPTPGSAKWWVGELGIFANHAAVIAQLIINNKRFGPHVFIVNIRDMKTHKPLEGIDVGDIGPKYGFNTKDNGFIKFSHVRIPRENMLSKYTKVSKDGEYERRGNQRVTYATMLTIRAGIPRSAYYAMSQAVTIATRYSLVRKQFKSESGSEIQIFDYQLQQNKIIPYIAETYALMFGSQKIRDIGAAVIKQVREKNDFTNLNPVHALSSGIKAIFTTDTLRAIQVMRRSAGGHGFSDYSGFTSLLQQIAPAATYEGENTILLLQTARFLTKSLASIRKGKPVVPFVSFMQQISKLQSLAINIQHVKDVFCPEILRRLFMHNSYYLVVEAGQKLMQGISEGLSPKQAWDHYAGIALAECGAAFTYFWIFQNFMNSVIAIQNETLKSVMNKVLCLYGAQKILENSKSYFEAKILSGPSLKNIFTAKEKLLEALRNQSIGLVEAFCYDDNTLKSAIGRKDGAVYQTLLEWARVHNRVNRPEVRRELQNSLRANIKGVDIRKPKL